MVTYANYRREPENWESSTLAQIADVVMGQSPKGHTCNTDSQGVPLLNGPTEFGAHSPTPVQFTIDPRKLAEKGDILFCVRGSTTGRMNWANQQYAIGRGVAALRHKQGAEYQPFLKALIDSHLAELLVATTGSTFPNVSRDQLQGLPILIPPLSEQKAISDLLSSLDDKIELLRRQNETLEQIAQAIFKEWFVDFNFPDKDGQPYKASGGKMVDSELGPIPVGWKVDKLSEVVQVLDSKRVPLSKRQRENRRGQYPYYGATTIMDYVDDYLFDGVYLLLAEDGSVMDDKGYPGLQYVWGKIWVNNHAHVLQGTNDFCTEMLYLYFKQRNIAEIVTGAVQLKINQTNLLGLDIVIPDNTQLRQFSQTIKDVFNKFRNNHDQMNTLAKLRDTLLPKLMDGEIRVGGA